MSDSISQCSRILHELQKHPDGIENYKFPAMRVLRYSARIADLRKEGHVILAERQVINGRSTGVWKYRLAGRESKLKRIFKKW